MIRTLLSSSSSAAAALTSASLQRRAIVSCLSSIHYPNFVASSSAAALTSTTTTTTTSDAATTIRFYYSSTATAAQGAAMRNVPPNLKIDPRSSFAPTVNKKYDDDAEIEVDDDKKKGDVAEPSAVAAAVDEEGYEDDDDELDDLPVIPQREVVYAIPLPDRLNIEVHSLFAGTTVSTTAASDSSVVGTLWLDPCVFGRDPIRVDLLQRAVEFYRAKKRGKRTAKTKTISEVAGSGKKMRQQKGTGKARAGHRRPPHWRGGAKAHGPKNTTDYGNIKMNKKVQKLALAAALSQKLKEGNLIVFDQLYELPTHKTKDLVQLLDPWNLGSTKKEAETALILDSYYPENEQENKTFTSSDINDPKATSFQGIPVNLYVASKNLFKLKVGNDYACNVYDILKYDKLVLTLEALKQIEGRLAKVLG